MQLKKSSYVHIMIFQYCKTGKFDKLGNLESMFLK